MRADRKDRRRGSVQPNRLLLFMRPAVLSASLDRACNAQSFYSGFYVGGTGGMLGQRDMMKSRAARAVRWLSQPLVAVRD